MEQQRSVNRPTRKRFLIQCREKITTFKLPIFVVVDYMNKNWLRSPN